MADDNDELLDAITDVIPKLLGVMDAFEQVQANAHPGRYDRLAEYLAPYGNQLAEANSRFAPLSFPEELMPFRDRIAGGIEYALRACDNIQRHGEGTGRVMQAMRAQCRAQESIYPLAAIMSPVSQYFVEAPSRTNQDLLQQLYEGADRAGVGLHHARNDRDTRGGFSLYVPENLPEDKPASLVIALHGGTGHGADFIWSWLREARTRGFILMAPTSQSNTWSLMGEELDLPALLAMLDLVKGERAIDESHILLTGMSDGGTWSLVAGLNADSPFTHLAPFSGVLHPDIPMSGNIRHADGRPIYLVHGTQDWMFPVEVAWMAKQELEAAGADLTFRIIEGLSHTYARGENPALIEWFNPDLKLPG